MLVLLAILSVKLLILQDQDSNLDPLNFNKSGALSTRCSINWPVRPTAIKVVWLPHFYLLLRLHRSLEDTEDSWSLSLRRHLYTISSRGWSRALNVREKNATETYHMGIEPDSGSPVSAAVWCSTQPPLQQSGAPLRHHCSSLVLHSATTGYSSLMLHSATTAAVWCSTQSPLDTAVWCSTQPPLDESVRQPHNCLTVSKATFCVNLLERKSIQRMQASV
jgi:hypothetical protein